MFYSNHFYGENDEKQWKIDDILENNVELLLFMIDWIGYYVLWW